MGIKQFIKANFSFLIGIRRYYYYLKKWYVYPCAIKRFGSIGPHVFIDTPSFFTNQKDVFLEDHLMIRFGFKLINYTGKLIVKKYTMIAPCCTIVTGNHTKNISVPQMMACINHINDNEGDIVIEEDVWIGINCTLLHGCSIGRGAVIGGCSMVNKPIPPYAVAVGSPAKIIASTFSIDEIIKHEMALYPESERYTREELENIFETHFAGKKSIGHDISEETQNEIYKLKRIVGIPCYTK